MLVLTRKRGESIRIGDGIIIKVLENSGKQVKIGISVPSPSYKFVAVALTPPLSWVWIRVAYPLLMATLVRSG